MKDFLGTVITIIIIAGGIVWWIDKKAEDRFDLIVEEFRIEQKRLEETLRKDFKKTTDRVLQNLKEDRAKTEELINDFANQIGSSKPSGIDGRFLRD